MPMKGANFGAASDSAMMEDGLRDVERGRMRGYGKEIRERGVVVVD
jgi:hypothetical protein